MTDKEILDYCKSTNNRLKALRKKREELPNDKVGNEKWESIKEEIFSINKEVMAKLNKLDCKTNDVSALLALAQLAGDMAEDIQYYIPKY